MGESGRARPIGEFLEAVFTAPALRYAFAFLFLAYVALGLTYLDIDQGNVDYWQHLSAIRSLSADVITPAPLYIDADYETHLYTPYHLFWAIVFRVTDIDLFDLSIVIGLTNAALFLTACKCLAVRFLRRKDYDATVALVLLYFWGNHITWSGFYSFAMLPIMTVYPYQFAFPVSLILISFFFDPPFRSRTWYLVFALAVFIVFLTHPITASFLLLSLAVKVLIAKDATTSEKIFGFAPLLGGLLCGFFWPYFSVADVVFVTVGDMSAFGGSEAFYDHPARQAGPAILGVLALLQLRRKAPRDFFAVGLLACTLVYAGNLAGEVSNVLSRYLIYIIFFLQMLFLYLLRFAGDVRWRSAVWVIFFLVVGVAGVHHTRIALGNQFGLYRDLALGTPWGRHSTRYHFADFRAMAGGAAAPQVVMVDPRWAFVVTAYTDLRVVATPWGHPTMTNFAARLGDARSFFDPATPADEKKHLLEKYDVSFIILSKGAIEGFADLAERLERRVDRAGLRPLSRTTAPRAAVSLPPARPPAKNHRVRRILYR